jgi:hypothetical protein
MGSPIVFQDLSGLAQGITGAGSALAQALGQRVQQQRQRQSLSSLVNAFSQIDPNAPAEEQFTALNKVLREGNIDPSIAAPFVQNLFKSTQERALQREKNITAPGKVFSEDEFSQALDDLGLSEEQKSAYVNLYRNASTGGRTAITKSLLNEVDILKASGSRTQATQPNQQQIAKTNVEPNNLASDVEPAPYQFPQLETFECLNRTQKQKRQNDLRKENTPFYKDSIKKLESLKKEKLSIDKLSQLNDTKKLPKGLGKLLNVNQSTGELRFPGQANPETQEYVKILNDFTTKAKDSYGANVTNFDLRQFMNRLPGLLNSDVGRRYVFQYMKSINAIDQLRNDSLKEVYNHYKISNLTPQDAEEIAEKLRAEKEQQLYQDALTADVKAQELFEVIDATPKGQVAILLDGQFGYIPENEIEEAQKLGAEIL